MFYYYGRKKQIAGRYPPPKHGTIIEPFAGSAAYSLHGDHWQRRVILIDDSRWCIDIWRLLQDSTRASIEALPDIGPGQSLNDHRWLSRAERDLIGLHINPGSATPKVTATKFSRWPAGRKYISGNLHKIKHWEISQGDFSASPDIKATWFIDPPYQGAGKHYASQPDYAILRDWILSRKGEVIACEGGKADYLPFIPLATINNGGINKSKRSAELIFHQTPV